MRDAGESKAGKKYLTRAQREIELHEFASTAPTQTEALAELALLFAEAGDPGKAWRALDLAEDFLREKDYTEHLKYPALVTLTVARFKLLALSGDDWRMEPVFTALHSAASKSRLKYMASLATLLGSHREGFSLTSESIHLFPSEQRQWIKAWLYYGASLMPTSEASHDELVNQLRHFISGLYASTGPHLAKSHLVATQALRHLSPNLLQVTLHEEVRNRLGSKLFPQIRPETPWLNTLEFNPSDPLLLQSFSMLARFGDVPGQALVHQLLGAPQFPEAWKAPLERALRRRGYYQSEDDPADFN